ncbi:MAG: ADP-ribosylglycohydrolase family protein [Acidimicrobiia bacterium]|nr:ADP-ribosylglycohydrolase family protein [Acidimicrobiia bacterium]
MDHDPTARDRAIGALVGLAVGDAVGTTLEFQPPGTFTPITDMVGGGPFHLTTGQWTDDTSMALCLAESLLDTGAMDLADQMRRYSLWRTDGHLSSNGHCFDIGNTVSSQLRRFARTGEPIDPAPDEESAANGSLMRLAPVPIRWHTDPADAAERSAESSRPTHAATRPVDACRLMGAMLSALIGGQPSDQVFAPDFWKFGDLHTQVEAIARGSWRAKEPPVIRGTGFCIDALEAAIWAVAGASDFRAAVLRAANLGDDADTTAAIAGQLAGARWGASAIPAEWRSKISMVERIETMADRLYAAGSVDEPVGPWAHDETFHAWWVEPGRVLAGEYPGDGSSPERAAEKVNLLVDAGVRTFVDLTEEGELAPYAHLVEAAATARQLDLRHRRFPIPDFSTLDDELYDDIVDAIRTEAERGAVFVHCWGGVGRTGTVIGCLLLDSGVDHADLDDRLAQLRHGTKKANRPSPENQQQRDVILRRASRR